MSCKDCIFSVAERQGHEISKQLLCRRNPPVPFPIPQQGGIAVMSLLPVVNEEGWCGEFDDEKEGEQIAPMYLPKIDLN